MKITIFAILIFNFQAFSLYKLSSDIKSPELSLSLTHLDEQKEEETLTLYAGKLNRWAEDVELTNLELIIKTEFYKSFLNDAPQVEGVKTQLLKSGQLKEINLKLSTPKQSQFTQWFIKNLLEDYPSSTAGQKKYISPWLMRFLEMSTASWNQLINQSIMNYFNNLEAHLQMVHQFARTDRTASQKLTNKILIDWEQDNTQSSPLPSKSEAIDLIDKNLPKTP